jgi:hypothetical protein
VRSVLSVGCGAGLSELLLAVNHPEVAFTLTDYDEAQLARPREVVERFGLTNVEVARLDLLDPPALPTHDLVVSIEVLEHIEDDVAALGTMKALSDRFVWALVPYCDEDQFADPRLRRRVLESHEHVRPGYPHAVLADRFADVATVWQRNCYFEPAAAALRNQMTETRSPLLLLEQARLFELVAQDVRSERVDDGRLASGIEILADVTGRPAT